MNDTAMKHGPEGVACLRCGGALDSTPDEAFLHCRYCGTDHEVIEEESVPASMPPKWCASKDAREALRKVLRDRGIRASVTTEIDLYWLVFWRIRAKLVGWQFYQKRPDVVSTAARREDGSEIRPVQMPAERVEELVARDVDVTLPACDSRSFDVVGISDRVPQIDWVPFSAERVGEKSHLVSVAVPCSACRCSARGPACSTTRSGACTSRWPASRESPTSTPCAPGSSAVTVSVRAARRRRPGMPPPVPPGGSRASTPCSLSSASPDGHCTAGESAAHTVISATGAAG